MYNFGLKIEKCSAKDLLKKCLNTVVLNKTEKKVEDKNGKK